MMMRKSSFNHMLSSFNDVVQIENFVTEFRKDPILYVIYMRSGYYETKLMINRDMDKASKALEQM